MKLSSLLMLSISDSLDFYDPEPQYRIFVRDMGLFKNEKSLSVTNSVSLLIISGPSHCIFRQ